MIEAYDKKTIATFDLDGLGKYFDKIIEIRKRDKNMAVLKVESFCEGYEAAVEVIAHQLSERNFRVEEGENNE